MVDPKSYQLAEYFLDDFGAVVDVLKMSLAQAIQDAAEDWLNAAEKCGEIVEETWEQHEKRLGFLNDEDELRSDLDADRLREEQEERRALEREDAERGFGRED